MAESAIAVANYFVNKGIEENKSVTPMKVQKLVYLAHGWHLGLTGRDLIDDKIGAWPFGPVIGSIYKKFIKYAKSNITELTKDESGEAITLKAKDTDTLGILDRVWEVYKDYTATSLSNMTHQEGSPWHQCYVEGQSRIIDSEVIKKYFQERLK